MILTEDLHITAATDAHKQQLRKINPVRDNLLTATMLEAVPARPPAIRFATL